MGEITKLTDYELILEEFYSVATTLVTFKILVVPQKL